MWKCSSATVTVTVAYLLHKNTLSVPADSLGFTTHLNGPPLHSVRSSAQKLRTCSSVVASFWVTARTPFLRISSCMMYLLRRAWGRVEW